MTKNISSYTGEDVSTRKASLLVSSLESNDMTLLEDNLMVVKEECKYNRHMARWLTTPVIITEIHDKLIKNYEVDPRALRLRRRVGNVHHRAELFCQAMLNGINIVKKKVQ
jgi:hypothetical protein